VPTRVFGLAVCFIGCTGQALCQTGSPADSDAYQEFFSQVRMLAGRQLRIQDAIPLTDKEAAAVSDISTEIGSQIMRLRSARGAVKKEGLFRYIEDEANSSKHHEWKNQQLKIIDDAEKRIISRSVEKLKETLGDPRFQVLEGHVRSGTLASHISMVLPRRK
jgi:hypothetical protein